MPTREVAGSVGDADRKADVHKRDTVARRRNASAICRGGVWVRRGQERFCRFCLPGPEFPGRGAGKTRRRYASAADGLTAEITTS